MSLGKRLISTGAGDAVCNTESVQPFGADSTYSSNIALYQFEDNANDTTGNYNGTASNVTYASGYINNAAVFNGSSSVFDTNLSVPTNWTVSLWLKRTPNGYFGGTTNSSVRSGVYFYANSNGKIQVNNRNSSGGNIDSLSTSTGLVTEGNWHHIAITFDSTSGTGLTTVYIDGVNEGTLDGTPTHSTDFKFGRSGDYAVEYFNGSIDQIRIFNKSLSADDVATLYAETSSTASNTNPLSEGAGKLLYTFDYDASDAGGYYDGTPTDVEFGTSGKINTGVRFPQTTTQRIQFTNPISNASNTDFNVSFFASFRSKTGGSAGSFAYAIINNPVNQYGAFQIYTYYHASGLVFMLQRVVGSTIYYSSGYNTDIPVSITLNTFNHYSINYTASSYQIEVFKDGVSQGNSTLNTAASVTPISTSSLGYSPSSSANAFPGSLDQFRIFSKTLTDSEISTLAQDETACVHTSTTDNNDFPVTNTAYYKLDNSAEDSKGTNDGTETDIEYRFGRYGQAAVFNGSSSRINTGYQIPSGLTGFSVSVWVKAASVKTQFIVGDLGDGGAAADGMFQINISSSNKLRAAVGGTVSQDIATLSSYIDTWTHIVVTTDSSGNIIGYVNGNQVGTASGNSLAANTEDFMIGMFGDITHSSTFNGLIDQVRIFQSELSAANVTKLYNEKPETDTSDFKTVLYKGTGSTQYISNVGFDLNVDNGGDGGLVWIKNRDDLYSHQLYDTVRGATKKLLSDNPIAEDTDNTALSSFDKNGFFVGSNVGVNDNNDKHVAWVWKGGGEAVTLTNTGNINSDVSVNNETGFSIVKATYGSSSQEFQKTVKHGLTTTPQIIISKSINASQDWIVWAPTLIGASKNLRLNDSDSINDNADDPNFTINSDGTFNTGFSSNNFSIIAYCWHSVAGYSKIGTYEGNGTTATTTINTGFEPSWVMIKRTDSANFWVIFDNKRDTTSPLSKILYANTNDDDQEGGTTTSITISSTGFSMSTSQFGGSINTDGGQYLYMAFK